MRQLRFVLWLFLLLGACVPSPTATPPRQSPFPTLPLHTDVSPTADRRQPTADGRPPTANSQQPTADRQPPTANSQQPTADRQPPTADRQPPTADRRPPTADMSLPPLVQITVQDPELPVSVGQTVTLNILSADDQGIAWLDVYANGMLFETVTPPVVAPRTFATAVHWQAPGTGKHLLRVIAYDVTRQASDAAQVELKVITNNRAPQVLITAPSGGKDAELGAPLLIQGVATDDVAVTRIDLIVDNQLVTYVTPDNPDGVTPFAVAIPWTPLTTGPHTIVLRAYDNQGQSDDSLALGVRVYDNQPPVITARAERTTIRPEDALIVNALALAGNGVSRLELYVDDVLADTVRSHTPAMQTVLEAQLVWAPDREGEHTFFVRAFDVIESSADSPRQTIRVQAGAARSGQETPAEAQTPFPRAPSTDVSASTDVPPTRLYTYTPTLVLPSAPMVELRVTNGVSPIQLPAAAHLLVLAHGAVELERVEAWARVPGETMAHLIFIESAKGATDETFEFDWTPPRAGVFQVVARVTDHLGQQSDSPPLLLNFVAPRAPSTDVSATRLYTPAVFDFAQPWVAASPAAQYRVQFLQIGRALRGLFDETRADGTRLAGIVVSGRIDPNRIMFGVEFAPHGSAPRHTLDFDCVFDAQAPALLCNYVDENQNRGSAVFRR